MHTVESFSLIPQSWSWKVCVLIAALAVSVDLLLVQFPLVWVGTAAVVAVLAAFRNPMSGLAVVIFSCGLLNSTPFEDGVWSRLFPGVVALGIFLFAWLMRARSAGFRSFFRPSVLNAPLLGLAIVTPVTMLWSRIFPDPDVTYSFPHSDVSWTTVQITQLALLVATLAIPFTVAAGIKRWKDVEAVVITIGVVVAIGTLLTAGGLIFGFGGSYAILGVRRAYWGQAWDSTMDPVTTLCLPFFYAGVLFGRRSLPRSRYWLVCLLFLLCLLGVVLTISRASWILGFLGLLVVSAAWLRSRVSPFVALLASVLVLLTVLFSGVVGQVSRFYDPDEVYGFERVFYYLMALRLFATHPVIGVGAGNYQFFDRTYEGEAAGGIAHNQFLTMAAETGIAGLAMLLWLVVALLKLRRQLRTAPQPLGDRQNWVRVGGAVFLLVWIAECFFQEAFFVTAAAGGGTKVMTVMVFPWTLLGVLLATCNLSQASPELEI